MKIIFFGSVTDMDEAQQLSGNSVAGNKMQLSILKELNKYEDVSLYIFSLLSIASFPRDKHLWCKKKTKEIEPGLEVTQVPFINIPIIKQITQIWSLYHYGSKKAQKHDLVFSYNLYPQEGCALLRMKRKIKCKTVSLLADLPIDDDYNRHGLNKVLAALYFDITRKNILACEKLIVLNKEAVNEFAPYANYIVVEGGVNKDKVGKLTLRTENKKNIVFSGALIKYNGILELAKAVAKVSNSDICLEIYGDGILKPQILEIVKQSPNVFYMGKVSNEEMMKIQGKSWLLANPRPVDDSIAKVTFPSKIFEYMQSGRPILTTKLSCFSEEYLDKMYFIDNTQPETIIDKINEIIALKEEDMAQMGYKAKKFIQNEKNWEKQAEKIYRFLNKV